MLQMILNSQPFGYTHFQTAQSEPGPSTAHPVHPRRLTGGPPSDYKFMGDCTCVCSHCHAGFWFAERLSHSYSGSGLKYHGHYKEQFVKGAFSHHHQCVIVDTQISTDA